MMGDCNKCVYSTRDGGCRKWTCEGTKTVDDIKAEAFDEFKNEIKKCCSIVGNCDFDDLDRIAKQLKEQK